MSATEAHRAAPEPFRFVGFPLAAWAFAARIWIAMMVALYAAFWLQLDSASSSAVTVAILAQPRRGQAFDKAIYRLGATLVGFAASIVITAIFTQSRDLFVVAYAGWIALAVYVANCYDGTRAYGAVLSGYTVAIIAVSQIDSPQNVFTTGIARVAVVSLGIASIALINDVLLAPDIYPGLIQRMRAAREATRDLVRACVRGEDPGPDRTIGVLGDIVGCRLDILSLPSENPRGRPRCEAGKSTVAALVGSISAARAYMLLMRRSPHQRDARIDDALAADDSETIADTLDAELCREEPSADRVMVLDCALNLALRQRLATEELAAVESAAWPQRRLRLPIHRDREYALRSAFRVFIAICAAAVFLIQSSWPMTSVALTQVGVFAGLSATMPDPRAFAKGALIAMPLAVAVAGITEFLILDGADAFPLLAIGLAPAIFGACLLLLNPKTGGIGFLLLVFTLVIFPPSNPQSYNPQSYVLTATLAVVGVGLFAALLLTVLPTTDRDRRRWLVNAARRDLLRVSQGEGKLTAAEATYLTADRIVALSRFKIGGPGGRRGRLLYTLVLSNLTNAATRGLEGLDALHRRRLCGPEAAQAREAFASLDCAALREAAHALSRTDWPDEREVRFSVARAVAALQLSALLLEDYSSTLRHLRWALAS